MTTFGGHSVPFVFGGGGDGFGPSFTSGPFELHDDTLTINEAGPNIQVRLINTDSSIINPVGAFIGSLPQQFGVTFPAGFPNPDPASGFPYKYRWVGDLGPDTPDLNFPAFNTFRDINTTIAIGFLLASGQSREGNVVIEGYSGDALTVLARCRWRLLFSAT